MKLSILDLSIVPKNGSRTNALKNTLDLAQQAEKWGYNRFWVAEHHATKIGAGRTLEVMIPYLAAQTEKIKLGSRAILLNHYSPYKIAEVFNTLEELFPNRIDMGIGRATTGPITDMALQRKRSVYHGNTDDSTEQVVEFFRWMNQNFEKDDPFSDIASYNNGTSPEFWLLSSSSWSANIAAKTWVALCFCRIYKPLNVL